MSDSIFFDQALSAAAEQISAHAGVAVLNAGVLIRDTAGRIKFVTAVETRAFENPEALVQALQQSLGPYARADGVLAFADEPGSSKLLADADRLYVDDGVNTFWLLDRRIVGTAWLTEPNSTIAFPPRVVFASLKGGVGRSTALTIAAADLASRGMNVLVVDLDLEAPGLGDLLLSEERTPKFGITDYLVESGLREISERSLYQFIGTSSLTTATGGRVDVLPAFGTNALNYPAHALAKLARAMTDSIDENGDLITVGSKISMMIERITQFEAYDIVLIDSRAGLAELAAPAVLSLGALVLFFGTAQRQTIHGYRLLFAGLRTLAQRASQLGKSSDWRLMIRPVYAKASMNRDKIAAHADDLYELFADNIYDEVDDDAEFTNLINFAPDDPDAPHQPLIIPFDSRFLDFDPTTRKDQLTGEFFEQTYRPFLDKLSDAIDSLYPTAARV